jgi:hydroxyacylglutathione hydrolase
VIDPAEAAPVLRCLDSLNAELVAIFNTHHHWDHIGGNQALKQRFEKLRVYAASADRGRIPEQEIFLEESDRVEFADRMGEVLFVPGHTRAHIAYYFPPTEDESIGELFCGDTIFAGGCGRLFEGTPTQMVHSLSKLRQLPNQTRIWCAHEYTLKNLQFALTVDPNNSKLKRRYLEVQKLRTQGKATIPSMLEIEKLTNPFLRWDTPELQTAMKSADPIQVFARLRGKRDLF